MVRCRNYVAADLVRYIGVHVVCFVAYSDLSCTISDYRYGGRVRCGVSGLKDQSLMSYRGHRVFQTLVRCYFSPQHSTGQRYVYSGSYDGCVYGKCYSCEVRVCVLCVCLVCFSVCVCACVYVLPACHRARCYFDVFSLALFDGCVCACMPVRVLCLFCPCVS